MDRYNIVSFCGIFVVAGIAWIFSANRRRLNFRLIGFGIAIQLLLALVVFGSPNSTKVFLYINDIVVRVIEAAAAGQRFLFGPLALPPGQTGPGGEESVGFILAIQALPIIVFFAALMGLLYYLRIMPLVIRAFAYVFTRLLSVSGAESLCAASNIFVGVESATTIRPYLSKMTRSEFCTILTAGMATVASSTLGLYILFLKDVFPTIAGHLISASVISAPAAIVISKIIMPEDSQPLTLGKHIDLQYERDSSAIEAIINGAMAGVRLLAGVVALLIAFLGLVAIVDIGLAWTGNLCGRLFDAQFHWSLELLLGKMMSPLAVVIGIPPSDADLAATLLGKRLTATEIPAYLDLAQAVSDGSFSHSRSPVIVAYALCGFAHIASLAIFVGGVAALVPERRSDLASVGPRALLAATLACLMTGAVAGTFFHTAQTVLGSTPEG